MFISKICINERRPANMMQFDTANQSKKRNWNEFFANWKAGKMTWENLSDEEKQYVMAHDPMYAQMFV